MWPFSPIRTEHIVVSITPTQITCGWVGNTKKHPFILKAYYCHTYESPTPITLRKSITEFIAHHQLEHASIHIALSSPLMYEQLMRFSHATPQLQDFAFPELKKMLWDYRYLHPLEDGTNLFYVCGMPRTHWFAYQLLAHQSKTYLCTLTSSYMALLHAYKTFFGPAYRQSQLALDMIKHEYKIEESINTTSIARLLPISPAVSLDVAQEKLSLLTIIGLCYQERE